MKSKITCRSFLPVVFLPTVLCLENGIPDIKAIAPTTSSNTVSPHTAELISRYLRLCQKEFQVVNIFAPTRPLIILVYSMYAQPRTAFIFMSVPATLCSPKLFSVALLPSSFTLRLFLSDDSEQIYRVFASLPRVLGIAKNLALFLEPEFCATWLLEENFQAFILANSKRSC